MSRWMGAGLAAALLATGPATAKVTDQNANGFTVVLEGDISITPDFAYKRFLDIGAWWSDSHTFSGKAANLTITAQQGGCWCETLPNGGFVRHLDVAYADPGKMLIFRGGLGPLLFMGANGAMTVKFVHLDEGTHVTLTYAVGGYDPGGWGDLSKAVDGVLAEQFRSYLAGLSAPP